MKQGWLFAFLREGKRQIIDFTKQMATLLNSGIKLTEALSVLTMQISNPGFKNALTDIRDRVMTGESLTDAMKDYGDYFDIIYVSMVRVGEVTGSLGDSFATIAAFMEKRQRVESKIITAMVYPAFLLMFCLAAVIILTTTVIPKIARKSRPRPETALDYKAANELQLRSDKLVGDCGYRRIVAAIIWRLKRFLKTKRATYAR